ncbi:uncharacterized protein LOC129989147 [Argiope bruennichi]|uniref:uncharacterized protein LOC129989147 n=1 Tax=Argiope bruennichi TaxID=94029 RepID=UPI00249459E1|nr:uncharacterized protein LOC129989147 [Argiope bruennichi]
MEFFGWDIFVLLISLISATIVGIYIFLTTFLCFRLDCIEAVAVHDIIKVLKRVCPVDFGNKWKLLPLNAGSSRCWTKKAQFPGFQNNVTLYGTACAAACSSVYAFSLIADVTKWGEWEPLPSAQCLLLKPFCDSKLQKDALMQADQVVGIQKGADIQSYIAMYRFMSFTEKTVKWILFWNAKKLEFMFFLIQPAVSKTVDNQCVITHIFGTKPSSYHLATTIAQRMRNIKDFLHLSQIHIVSSKYTSAIPAISTRSVSGKLGLESQPYKVPAKTTAEELQYVFMLVPVIYNLKGIYSRLKGFKLIVKEIDDELVSKKEKKKGPVVAAHPVPAVEAEAPTETLKRSVSDACIKSKKHADFSSSLNLNKLSFKEKSSIIAKAADPRINSVIVEEKFKIDLNSNEETEITNASTDNKKVRSYSEPASSNIEKSKTSSDTDTHTDEDVYVNLHIIHESVSQENVSSMESCSRSDYFCSSTSDFELVDSKQQFLDCRLADFLTQGNYAASELQFEMMQASHFDKSTPEQRGCWGYHSTYKGITVLSKTTAGQFMKVESYLCQVEFPYNAEDIWKCVKNPRFRFIYDETVKTVKIVERISESQKLIHIYHEANAFIKKEGTDFCLLQTERKEANLFYSSFHSIEYEKCPFMDGVLRGTLKPSGWVVENLGSHQCKVTHLMQIIVSSSDNVYINQLSSVVPLAIHNLKNYLASKPCRK